MPDLKVLLARVADPESPEDRDEAWDAIVDERDQLRRRLDLVSDQIGLYETSHSDEMGVDPEGTLVCIANILEYGHPAGPEVDAEQREGPSA